MNLSVYPSLSHPGKRSAFGVQTNARGSVDLHEEARQSAIARRLRLAAEEANQMTPASKSNSKQDTGRSSKKKLSYNFKEISAQIFRARNSFSAGKAVLQAKRKVVELKRKLAAKDTDENELAIALNHAKRMELAARRKKRHLEIEEYVKNHLEEEEKSTAAEESASSLLSLAEERLVEGQEEVLTRSEEEQEAMREELTASMAEETKALSEEQTQMLSDVMAEEMNALLSDAEEQAMEMLEETLSQLEALESATPHMSKEAFEKMVKKHRHSEQKEILRADMDYLKNMFSYLSEKSQNESCPAAGVPTTSGSFDCSFQCGFSLEG